MENVVKEDVLQALNEFEVRNDIPIPSLLEEYLHFVASTGDTVFPWTIIKVLVRRKIEQVLCDFLITSSPESVPASPNVDPFKYALMKEKILEALEYFNQAPFTIQRLCEVMVDPKRYYKRVDKLMRAIEKNLLVTTTTEPRRPSSPHAHMSGVVNGFEDRTNGHHSTEQEDEPMDTTQAPCQPVVVGNFGECPITGKASEDDDDGIEDIDVDQTPDVISSHTPPQSFDVTMAEVQQGGSSQENLLQIQLQMREQQQQREQLILVNAGDHAGVEQSSPQSSEKSESEEASARSNENSCSNDTTSDLEQGDTRESQLETELEQQVPQFVLCEAAGDPGRSPVQFQSITSQSQESSKSEKNQIPVSSSSLEVPERSSAIMTDQSSVVESSQSDSIDGSNEAAAMSGTSLSHEGENTTTKMTTAAATSPAAAETAATTSTTATTSDAKPETNNSSENTSAADSQEGSADRSPGEAELPSTNSPGNEAVAKE